MERVLQLKRMGLLHVWEWLRNFTRGAHCEPCHASNELAYRTALFICLLSVFLLVSWFCWFLVSLPRFFPFLMFSFLLSCPLLHVCCLSISFSFFIIFLLFPYLYVVYLFLLFVLFEFFSSVTFPPHFSSVLQFFILYLSPYSSHSFLFEFYACCLSTVIIWHWQAS
jgi:hypothetical protein